MQLFSPEWAAWEGREILMKCHMVNSLQESYKIGEWVVSAYADKWDYINEYELFHLWSCSCWTVRASKKENSGKRCDPDPSTGGVEKEVAETQHSEMLCLHSQEINQAPPSTLWQSLQVPNSSESHTSLLCSGKAISSLPQNIYQSSSLENFPWDRSQITHWKNSICVSLGFFFNHRNGYNSATLLQQVIVDDCSWILTYSYFVSMCLYMHRSTHIDMCVCTVCVCAYVCVCVRVGNVVVKKLTIWLIIAY